MSNKLEAQDLIGLISENIRPDCFVNDDVYDIDKEILEQIGSYRTVSHRTGDNDYYVHILVYYFEKHNLYLQLKGYFNSYEAMVDYDEANWVEVKPKEITTIIYE